MDAEEIKALQDEEFEVLESIYEGDDAFSIQDKAKKNHFQYKFGEDGSGKSFVLDLRWGEQYPEVMPEISMETFYNRHLKPEVKEKIDLAVKEEAELASVARALGVDAIRDLKALGIRMSDVARQQPLNDGKSGDSTEQHANGNSTSSASNSVAVSTSTSELKLLRVLQTLQALCIDPPDDASSKKNEGVFVTEELVQLLRAMNLDDLWAELTNCLKIVQVLEGNRHDIF